MKSCIKRFSDKWTIDNKNLKMQLKKNNVDIYDYSKVKDYVKNNALNNVAFLRYLIKKFKTVEISNYVFLYEPDEDSTAYCINISREDFLYYFQKRNNLNLLVHSLLKKIVYYTNPKYIEETVLSKNIIDKLTYRDLVNFLKKSPSELDIKEGDLILGYGGGDFLSLLTKSQLSLNDLSNSILRNLRLSEKEWKNIKENYNRIKYLYEVDTFAKSEFKPFRSVVDEFELNRKLEKNIMEEIPQEFNKLQTAYFIYKRLCQKFTYDEEFFCLGNHPKERATSKHTNINYLSTLEGGEKIICTGISLIYAKFLDKLKIPFQIFDYNNNPVEKLDNTHMKVRFKIDDYVVDADGANGLYESDMTQEKIDGVVKNFNVVNKSQKIRDTFYDELKLVDDYIQKFKENLEYKDAKDAYSNIMSQDYVNISLVERINLLIEIIDSLKINFFDMFIRIIEISKKILDSKNDQSTMEFIINNTNSPELNILIIYNECNNIEQSPLDNHYIVITPDHKKERIDYEQLKLRFKNNTYEFTNKNRNLLNLKEIGEEIAKGKNFK